MPSAAQLSKTILSWLPYPHKIRTKLLSIIIVITLFNTALLTFLTLREKTSSIRLESLQQQYDTVRQIANFIDETFTFRCQRLLLLFHHWHQSDRARLQAIHDSSSSIEQIFPTVLGATAAASTGQLFTHNYKYPTQAIPNLQLLDLHEIKALSTANAHFYIGMITWSSAWSEYVLPLYLVSTNPNSPRITLTVYLSINKFDQLIESLIGNRHIDLIIALPSGQILQHPRQHPGRIMPDYLPQNQIPLPDFSKKSHGAMVKLQPQINDIGIPIIRVYAPCPTLSWNIFIEQDISALQLRIQRENIFWIFLIAMPLILTLLLGLVYVRQLVQPLEDLEEGIKLFESGLLVEPLPVRTRDEIGRLTQAFNQMVLTLVARNEEIQHKNRRLSFIHEITSIINQTIDLNSILQRGLNKIMQMLAMPSGWVYVSDPQLKKLKFVNGQGLTPVLTEFLKTAAFNDTFYQRMTSGSKHFLLHDLSRYLVPSPETVSFEPVKEVWMIILRSKKRVVGVMALASPRKSTLNYRELEQLARVADELGIAVENALLYVELQLKIKERDEVNKDLQEMDRFKTRILSNVSHELRTPITSIKTYVELFIQDKIGALSAEQKDKLLIIRRNLNHLLSLIEDLLTLARIQDQKISLKNQEIGSIQELIDQVIAETLEMAKAKGLTLTRQGVEPAVLVRVNWIKMRQVLQNLIANAIKFTDRGSIMVTVAIVPGPVSPGSVTLPDPLVEIGVADTGIGIPKKSQKKIFQRFFQVDGSSTRKYVGTGLGLAIVKEIIEAHNSEILLDSTPQEGARFYFRLPIVNVAQFKDALWPFPPKGKEKS